MMFKLNNNSVLTEYQTEILKKFFDSQFGKQFFLTGGTALSAFYFAHRESKDFDFFTLEAYDPARLKTTIEEISKAVGAQVKVKVVADTYQEIYLENQKSGWIQRIDIIYEQPKHFGEIVEVDGIKVDSLINIATNKILTLLGRFEPKDYIDFYIIIKNSDLKFDELFQLAKQKDTGLFEFYFANSIASVDKIHTWPLLKVDLDLNDVKKYYNDLVRELFKKIKPK